MLLAYIDEIGEPGAFVSPTDPRFHTSPAFGYAGFIIPEEHARAFGAIFTAEKRNRFAYKGNRDSLAHLEIKGSDFFRGNVPDEHPENLRIFCHLVKRLGQLGGNLFYYADEKPLGTKKQTNLTPEAVEQREALAMQETLNRIARYADTQKSNVLITIDSINEKQRAIRVARMYQHIFARSAHFPEMRRLLEPPMHLDSKLSSNIQFADWIAGYITRAIDRQLIQDSKYMWVGEDDSAEEIWGNFTWDSKLHLWQRSIGDINHSKILSRNRALYPKAKGTTIGDTLHAQRIAKIKAAAERNHS